MPMSPWTFRARPLEGPESCLGYSCPSFVISFPGPVPPANWWKRTTFCLKGTGRSLVELLHYVTYDAPREVWAPEAAWPQPECFLLRTSAALRASKCCRTFTVQVAVWTPNVTVAFSAFLGKSLHFLNAFLVKVCICTFCVTGVCPGRGSYFRKRHTLLRTPR